MALFEADVWVTEVIKQRRTLVVEADDAADAQEKFNALVDGIEDADDEIEEWGDVKEEILVDNSPAEFNKVIVNGEWNINLTE